MKDITTRNYEDRIKDAFWLIRNLGCWFGEVKDTEQTFFWRRWVKPRPKKLANIGGNWNWIHVLPLNDSKRSMLQTNKSPLSVLRTTTRHDYWNHFTENCINYKYVWWRIGKNTIVITPTRPNGPKQWASVHYLGYVGWSISTPTTISTTPCPRCGVHHLFGNV